MGQPLNGTSRDIMHLIHGYLTQHFKRKKKNSSLIDQKWMMEKLDEWYGVNICRSTLCENLRILRERGFIRSIKRHRKNPDTQKFEPRKTLYVMTKRLKKYFLKLFKYSGCTNLSTTRPEAREERADVQQPYAHTPDFAAIRQKLGFAT